MTEEKVNIFIDRFLRDDISGSDYQILMDELKSPKNKEIIEDIIELDALVYPRINTKLDTSKAYRKVSGALGFSKSRRIARFKNIKYAAAVMLLIGVTYFYNMIFVGGSNTIQVIDENSITLQLENGNIEVITASGDKKVIDKNGKIVGTQSGDKLSYQKNSDIEKLVYNELKVPNGKTFQIILSDGTHVHLNAGTSLKYPVNFIKGQERRVFLVGEAYFDVAKDAVHPFIVSTEELDVRVLGTVFNVSSYHDAHNVNTVLVEGSVGIYKEGSTYNEQTSTQLTPGHIATWCNDEKNMSVNKVDTEEYTAWIDGKLIFKRRTFEEILKVLERHFDVEIVNNCDFLKSQRFLASFDTESVEQILEYFKKTNNFNYEINNNKIIINQP